MSRAKLTKLAANVDTPRQVMIVLRASISFINYLNFQATPNVNTRLTNIVNNAGAQWRHAQDVYNGINIGSLPVTVEPFWSEWVQDFFGVFLIDHTRSFVQWGIDEMRKYWAVRTGEDADLILGQLDSLEAQLANLAIKTDGMK